MKLIKAIVRPNMVDNIKEALGKLNIAGMTVTEVRGHGRQKGHTAVYRGREYEVSLLPKMEIEVVVPADVELRLDTHLGAGVVVLDGDEISTGIRHDDQRTVEPSSTASGSHGTIVLDLEVGAGRIEIDRVDIAAPHHALSPSPAVDSQRSASSSAAHSSHVSPPACRLPGSTRPGPRSTSDGSSMGA